MSRARPQHAQSKMNSATRRPRGDQGRSAPSWRSIDPADLYSDFLGDLNPNATCFAWACCPFHPDRHPSFCVNLDTGWYQCASSACGVSGSNIVGFVSALLDMDFASAKRYVERRYG